MMRIRTLSTVALLAIFSSACTNTDDPQLAMCQAVAKQLTNNTVASWDNIKQSDSGRTRTIAIAYGAANNGNGAINCTFPINPEGVVATAPDSVVLNGQRVGSKELLAAGVKASSEILKGTAATTVAKSKELAGEASALANDVANKALDAALETTKSLQQKLND